MHPTTKNAMDNHIESKALFYTDWYMLKLMSDIVFYIFTLHITVLIFVFYHFINLYYSSPIDSIKRLLNSFAVL